MDNYQQDPTYQSLLEAVCLDPKDNLPRGVIADWLEEHGEVERAEFIRVQLEFDAWQKGDAESSMSKEGMLIHLMIRTREHQLWQAHFPTQNDWGMGSGCKYAWQVTPRVDSNAREPLAILRRGFIDELRCQLSDWNDVQSIVWNRALPIPGAYGRNRYLHADPDDLESWNEYLADHLAPAAEANLNQVLDECIGKIYVM
jgi:uncharacterized protein (TIGR02996 family)